MGEAGGGLELAAAATMIAEELRRGREWAVQLQGGGGGGDINDDDDDGLLLLCPQQLQQQLLVQKIISCFEKCITLVNSNFIIIHHQHKDKDTSTPPFIPNNNNNSTPLPMVTTSSPTPPTTDEVSDGGDSPKLSSRRGGGGGGSVFKKRKTWGSQQQVRVCSATGGGLGGGGLDDGHSWRKYGQKDILGANHPRAYYRCTHRYTQSCMATKHIQRSDADPSIFEVTYKGTHTCTSSSSSSMSAESGCPNGARQLLHHQLQKQDEKQHGLLLLNNCGPTETGLDIDGSIIASDIFPTFVSPASSDDDDDDSTMNFSFLFDQNDDDYGFDELPQIMGRSESDSAAHSPFADWHLPADDDHQVLINLDAVDILDYFS